MPHRDLGRDPGANGAPAGSDDQGRRLEHLIGPDGVVGSGDGPEPEGSSEAPRIQDLASAFEERWAPVGLIAILLLAAVLRFVGVNWDENQHLHPDERFMTMVTTAIQLPASLAQYFDTARNPMSPYAHNFGFYVYGTAPLYFVKLLGIWLNRGGYDEITLVGRTASAAFDLLSMVVLYLIGRRLYGRRVGLLGTAFYAVSVLPIQLSHFYAVDTFANLFIVLAFFFAVRMSDRGRWVDFLAMGLAIGLAISCKVSAASVALVSVAGTALLIYRAWDRGGRSLKAVQGDLERTTVRLVVSGVLALVVFRVLQPIAFQGPSILNLTPNLQWIANMIEIGDLTSGARDFPPGHQWAFRAPILFPLENMVLWGLGLPLGIAAWASVAFATYELAARRRLAHLLPVLFVVLLFLYQGTAWALTMRYFIPLYPFLCLLAGYGLLAAWDWAAKRVNADETRRALVIAARAAAPVVLFLTAVWAAGFVTIYTRPHSRVDASRWIYDNVPRGSTLANEHWDDALPLRVDGKDGFGGWYNGIEMTNYDDDTPDKLNKMVERLDSADYVILSSNRLYGAIPRLPMRYPMTTRYYQLLLAGELGYTKAAEFTSYPRLFGLIDIPDQSSEESFTVYDHPKVDIFRKTSQFDAAEVKRKLGDGIDWDGIQRLTPLEATRAGATLMLSQPDRVTYQAAGTWSAMFNLDAWQNRLPVLAWVLVVELLGLAAAPLCLAVFGRLADHGYGISKTLGLLLTAWLAWLLATARIVQFGVVDVALALGLMLAVAVAIGVWRRRTIAEYLRAHWRLVLVEEAVFWLLFLGFLFVRYSNPDLWHPVLGGEKPMDFAYLNAVVKSAYFPPYDPWFAGGYINYYYFGFVMIATLIHLTGVAPHIAYNLAVPTLFALTGLGAFAAVFSLASGWSAAQRIWRGRIEWTRPVGALGAGLAAGVGVVFVAISGNLAEAGVLAKSLSDLSRVEFATSLPPLLGIAKVLDGALQVLVSGKALPARLEWWYWNATRVIPHPSTEAGPINEFPFFTFLYADLHAHMMALPITLCALTIAVAIVRDVRLPSTPNAPLRDLGSLARRIWSLAGDIILLAIAGVVVGALWPTNTWDLPTYAAVICGAVAIREYWRRRRIDWPMLAATGWRFALVLVVGYFAFLPFHGSNASAYTAVELWRGSRTPLDAYLLIHGMFLFVIGSYLLLEARHGRGLNLAARLLRLYVVRWGDNRRASRLRRLLVHETALGSAGYSLARFTLFALAWLVLIDHGPIALASVLLALAVLLLLSQRPEPRRQFVLLLISAGLALTLAVEIVVLKGDISRMNTVFKFYMQVWVMWGVAAAAALPIIAERIRAASTQVEEEVSADPLERDRVIAAAEDSGTPVGTVASTTADPANDPTVRASPEGPSVSWWWTAFAVLLAVCLLYPALATPAKIRDRFDPAVGSTLDGTAFMTRAIYQDQNRDIVLEWDRQAMKWLLENVPGSPVIAEANTPLYHWGSRYSMFTGLPDIVGWDWHQRQQRGALQDAALNKRLSDLKAIYTDTRTDLVVQLLKRYNVRYVIVGEVERAYYPAAGLAKFERYDGTDWDLVYENAKVRIYRVRE